MRVRKLGFIGLVCALGLAWGLPSHWRALGWEKQRMPDPLAAAARPVTLSAQATRYEFVEHVIDYEHPCDDTFYPRATRSTAQATYDFTFRSDTLAAGCTTATIPDGKITLNFPSTFTEGVSFTPAINVTGTFQLRVDAQNFTVRGYGLTVDTVIDRLPKREDPGVHQDLRNAPCPLTRFRKNPPLNGGTNAAPGLNPFANNASCSVKAPDAFQSYEGNQVLLISTIDLVVGGDPIGPANFFNYTGLRLLRFTITSKYKPATNSCPTLTLQNGFAGPEQSCPPAALRIETETDPKCQEKPDDPPCVFASNPVKVQVSARKKDGALDTSFNGTVQVSLAQGSTPKIGCLLSGNQQCAATLSLALEGGTHKQPLSLQTPEQELTFVSVLKPGNPVLEGKAIIKAESGNVSTTSEVKVKSPLDLKIERIEVQQGVKQDKPGTLVQGKDLLIRVFISANTEQFSKYGSIQGINARLIVHGAGFDIGGLIIPLTHGGFNKSNIPNEPFVFDPKPSSSIREVGGDSLNVVLEAALVKDDALSFEAKLNDVYPDRDPTNNSKFATPIIYNFAQSKSVSIIYSRARRRFSENSVGPLPSEEGLRRQMELLQLAYPVSQGRLHFVDTMKVEDLTDLPTGGTFTNIWFWINNPRSILAQAAVFFVDNNFFGSIGRNDVQGITIGNWGLPDTNGDQFVFSGGSVCVVDATCGPNLEGHCGTLAHEIGHTYTLGDTYSNVDAVYSFANPRKDNATGSGNRVEPGSFSWFVRKFSIADSEFRDFMGNSPNAWIDGQTWDALRGKILPTPTSEEIAQTGVANQTESLAPEASGPFVVIEGQIQKSGTARLDNAYTLTGNHLPITSSVGSHVIETLDANSSVLSSLAFTPQFRSLDGGFELDQTSFSFALPFSSTVRQIRLRSGSNILASRMVSANPPSVSFTSDFGGQSLTGIKTVSWTGADADGDALSYSLFYSPNGQLRIPLVTNTSATSFQWNTDELPSGPSPLLTLMATDGVRATLIDSRQFTLPNRAPQIVILSPGNQQQFKPGEVVDLEGSFHDPEEGLELNPQLEWSSNIQGVLGTGKRIGLNNLSTGTHLITAAGADSQGARGSATITVIVRPDNFSNLAAAQTNLDFGSVAVGQTRDLTLSIQNFGNAPFTVSAITSNNARFVATTPAAPFSIAARAQQDINVRFTPVAAGDQAGTLSIAANASNRSSLNVALAGKATGATPRTVATVSAASFNGQTLAVESIVAAFGASLATGVAAANTLPLPTSLAGTTVRVRDSLGTERLAPLFFVAPSQINYLIPAGTATGAATITVTSGDGALSLGNVSIAAVAPGLFAANANGQGVPAAAALRVKANGAQSYEPVARFDAGQNRFVSAPIDLGPASDQVFLLLFGTGLRFNSGLAGVTCKLGGIDAPVSFAGAQGDLAGLDQVNVSVPRTLAGRGEVDLVLTVDGSAANTVRLAFAGNQTCSYALSLSSQSFPSSGGTGSVNVTAPSGCAWTALSNASFITITSGASGTGNGTVNYSVAANTANSQRTGTLTIAGQTFTVTQAALPCSYVIPTTSQSFNANANTGSVNVTANSGCAWTATSNASFMTITSGATGNGNGTVTFNVAANTAANQRSGTLTIAGITFTVTQAGLGCNYAISPSSQSFNANANTGSVNVTANNGCAWTATSNASFIAITSSATGSGNGTVNYSVTANTASSTRSGTLTIAGQTFTVTQAGGSGACSFTLTPTNQLFTASGGSGNFNVAAQTGCNWTAATLESWIVITAGRTGSGNGRVDFTVAANASDIPRAGTITLAGQVFFVGQTGTGATCRLLPISIGQTINGELSTSDCGSPIYGNEYYADLFYFTATAGQRVAIQLTSSAFDAYLTLIGPDGEPVMEDDDGGGGTDARIPASSGFLTLPLSGTYIIEASSAFKREIGVYKLSLSAPSGSVSGKPNGRVSRLP